MRDPSIVHAAAAAELYRGWLGVMTGVGAAFNAAKLDVPATVGEPRRDDLL
jgi:hypothetical protein